jgi:hypothetical protein
MRAALALAALCAVAATLPAAAEAATWKGKTKQGRKAVVVTDDATGLVSRVRIGWRAPCQDGTYSSRTTFLPPFDTSTGTTFEDTGSYSARPDGYRTWTTATVHGRFYPHADRWRGRLDLTVRVRKAGKLVDTCRLKKLRWSAGRA